MQINYLLALSHKWLFYVQLMKLNEFVALLFLFFFLRGNGVRYVLF